MGTGYDCRGTVGVEKPLPVKVDDEGSSSLYDD